ncbi:hypothetical protein K456DRAFT_54469 [Colletotrichum gloeosporioides 23]|nr:hypothetical protein K456DRAFT_54469 [Colletotrichum gloeosporioides 23]
MPWGACFVSAVLFTLTVSHLKECILMASSIESLLQYDSFPSNFRNMPCLSRFCFKHVLGFLRLSSLALQTADPSA